MAAVCAAVGQIFGELGFERASIDEISQRGGGSKATIYNYFAIKEELFFEVIYQSTEAAFTATEAALNIDEPDLGRALEQFGQRQKCYAMAPARSEAMLASFLQHAID